MNNSSAFVHPDAKIGQNVVIEHFAYIDKDTEIGDGCWIGPNACIWEGSRIGNNCKIFAKEFNKGHLYISKGCVHLNLYKGKYTSHHVKVRFVYINKKLNLFKSK